MRKKMQARAEQSKNEILARVSSEVARSKRLIASSIQWFSLVVLAIVIVLVLLVALACCNLVLFVSVLVYLIIASLIYLSFVGQYVTKKIDNVEHTIVNSISSERAVIILNGAASAYNSA